MSALGRIRRLLSLRGNRARLCVAALVIVACRPTSVREPQWAKGRGRTLFDGECVVVDGGKTRCALTADEAAASALHAPVRSMASGGGIGQWARCAVTEAGRVACWGCFELLGSGLRRRSPAAPRFLPLANVKQVAVGQAGACALSDSGTISCWGEGFWSQSSDAINAAICQPGPTSLRPLAGFPRAERFAMTADGRSCVLTSDGQVFCQGSYHAPDSSVRRLAVPRARDIVAGLEHFCALGVDGSVTCWDENAYGQCGAPSEPCVDYVNGGCKAAPFRVALTAQAMAVTAGAEHSCALLEDGEVSCWGRNQHGALGFPPSENCHPNWRGSCNSVPKRVEGLDDVIQLVASKARVQTWALTASGQVLVWPEHRE